MLPHNIGSLGRAYQLAQEMEYYLKSTPPKRLDVRQPTKIAYWRQNTNNNRVGQPPRRSLTDIPRAEDKGKGILE